MESLTICTALVWIGKVKEKKKKKSEKIEEIRKKGD